MQNQNRFIPKHGGYRNLKSFQNAEIVYDLTVEFCNRFIKSHKMADQLVGAARSGVQNIAEGSSNSGTSKQTELRLVNVARGSLEELLRDYKDFLRQKGLVEWGKDDPWAKEVRNLAYRTDRVYATYKPYLENPEQAANAALCLIFQTTYLLDQQLQTLEKELLREGDVKERFRQARIDERKRQVFNAGPPIAEFLAGLGLATLPDGRVVEIDKKD